MLARGPLVSRSPFFIGTMNLPYKEIASKIYIENCEVQSHFLGIHREPVKLGTVNYFN